MNGAAAMSISFNFVQIKIKMKMNKYRTVLVVLLIITLSSFAQKSEVPKGWHLMDKETSGFYGVSADKAYSFIKSKNLKSKTVLVEVLI
jgi:hypothetical protein